MAKPSQPDLSDAALPVRDTLRNAIGREWDRLASPGTSLTGPERLHAANASRGKTAPPLERDPLAHVAHTIRHAVHDIDAAWVTSVRQDAGLSDANYVETCGIVSRLSAIDTWARGMSLDPLPLPSARPGSPNMAIANDAKREKSFVPVVGFPSALTALSLLPAENAARDDIHKPLYLTMEQMQDPLHQDDLSRAQIELVAARTSHLNACLY